MVSQRFMKQVLILKILILDINFFHCQHIVQLLKECGEGSTNFFGQYSSQRMKVLSMTLA